MFDGIKTEKYLTILIDEIQDFKPEWVKIIRDNFLDENGEMVLFGDQSQNIYERKDNQRDSPIVFGFGRWHKLTKSYRSAADAPLLQLFNIFQKRFLVEKYTDAEEFETAQASIYFDLMAFESYGTAYDHHFVLSRIYEYIRAHSLHPNDIVIISSQVEYLLPINEALKQNESTMVMFEEADELDALRGLQEVRPAEYHDELKKIRRRKKTFFMLNSGRIKLSTTHSFKGLEAQTVFYIVTPKDSAEIIYTGITRAQRNLIVFGPATGDFSDFFAQHLPASEATSESIIST